MKEVTTMREQSKQNSELAYQMIAEIKDGFYELRDMRMNFEKLKAIATYVRDSERKVREFLGRGELNGECEEFEIERAIVNLYAFADGYYEQTKESA